MFRTRNRTMSVSANYNDQDKCNNDDNMDQNKNNDKINESDK